MNSFEDLIDFILEFENEHSEGMRRMVAFCLGTST